MFEQFCLIYRWDLNRYNYFRSEWTGSYDNEEYSMFPIAPGLSDAVQCHTQNILLEGSYLSAEVQSTYSIDPIDKAKFYMESCFFPEKSRTPPINNI